MKKQISLLFVIFMMCATFSTFAQKPFVGTIVYEYSADGTDDPNVQSQLAAMKQEVTVMGNSTKTVADMGIGVINLTNGDYNLVTTIFDIPGYGKFYIEQDAEKLKENQEKVEYKYNETGDKKVIAGYNCKKVEVTVLDKETDEESTIILWMTDELLLGDNINFSQYPGLKGYPLCTEVTTDQTGETITIVTTATSVTPNKKIKSTNFLRPSDATPMSDAPEDIKKALGIE